MFTSHFEGNEILVEFSQSENKTDYGILADMHDTTKWGEKKFLSFEP